MSQCLKIVFTVDTMIKSSVASDIQKQAQKLNIEGLVQIENKQKLRIVACGLKEKIDLFLDILYKETSLKVNNDIEIEPFFKDKNYRGFFRIIE